MFLQTLHASLGGEPEATVRDGDRFRIVEKDGG